MLTTRAAGLLASVTLFAWATGSTAQTTENTEPVAPFEGVSVPIRMLGDPAAPVTIEEFASFVCPTCAEWHVNVLPTLRDLIDAGQVNVIFHDVIVDPVEASMKAAAIGLCAAPERFFDVAELFMDRLDEAVRDEDPDWFKNAVAASGRSEDEMDECAVSETTYNQIVAQQDTAETLRIGTLPLIRVNGQVIDSPLPEAIRAAVLAAPANSETISEIKPRD